MKRADGSNFPDCFIELPESLSTVHNGLFMYAHRLPPLSLLIRKCSLCHSFPEGFHIWLAEIHIFPFRPGNPLRVVQANNAPRWGRADEAEVQRRRFLCSTCEFCVRQPKKRSLSSDRGIEYIIIYTYIRHYAVIRDIIIISLF